MTLRANLGGVEVGDGLPVRIVGAINVSPESFYAGSVARSRVALQRLAVRMVEEGADLLDIGAMSTAPYVKGAIGEAEERRRLVAGVRSVRQVVTVPISVDTQRGSVAAAGLDAGAQVVNDVSGLGYDADMGNVARQAQGVILMASEERASREAAGDDGRGAVAAVPAAGTRGTHRAAAHRPRPRRRLLPAGRAAVVRGRLSVAGAAVAAASAAPAAAGGRIAEVIHR